MKEWPFLSGGGEMGALIRAHDWTQTSIGLPDNWPQGLRTAIRTMLNTRHPMYIFWGDEGLCLYNDAYRQSIGTERHPSSIGRPAREVWEEIWDIIGPQIRQVLTGDGATWHENQLIPITRNGVREEVYWTYGYGPIDEETAPHGIGGVLVICTETTTEVQRKQQMAAESERQRLLLQQMPGFVCVLNGPDHVFDYVNEAYVTISGPRLFIGRGVREVFPELEGQAFYGLLDQVYTSGAPFAARAMPIRLSGEEESRFIDFLYQPIRGSTGAVTGIFVGGYDVTEQVRAQKSLETLNASLNERVAIALREQSRMEEALRQSQKMEAVGQLTGGLAHDFNNLLAGISGSLEVAQTRISQGNFNAIERYLSAAQGASRRAAALTHRLLAFSRRQTLDPKIIDINRLVADMEDLVRRTVGPAIEIEVVGAGGLWLTSVDSNQLENALLNLCINARDAMPNGGRITIETANKWLDDRAAREHDVRPGQFVTLSVTDTGTGMTPEVIERAFDPFFTTKPLGQGTGLGLSMIYGFIRQSGGQVRIYSEVGRGTTVCVYLVRDQRKSDQDLPTMMPSHANSHGAGEVVLIIDDEPTVRMLVMEVLQEAGYAAIEAADGPTGLRVLQSPAQIDLLITDVGLPGGMNGRQIADAARTLRPNLKVLFITGYAENAIVGNGHLEPGMQVVTKPFAMDMLARKIREMVGG